LGDISGPFLDDDGGEIVSRRSDDETRR